MNAIRYIIGEEILTRNEIFEIRFCLIPGELKLRLRRAKKKEKIEEEGRGNASGKYFCFSSRRIESRICNAHMFQRAKEISF